ncbi:MAG: sugar porter family MFS transporter [Candidatus Bathyarchaeota archaeon]|nr:sugar porter family MFS transporter [Candidatus Bathyarchaeota archaeon]
MSKPTKQKITAILIVATAIAAVGGILFGFDTGVISGAILYIVKDWSLNSAEESIATSAVLIGAILGAILGGVLADRLGRKRSIIAGSVSFIIGTLILLGSNGLGVFVVGRVLIGVAIGLASFIVPMYISELAPERIRGALVSLNQLFVTLGILVSYGVDNIFSASGAWKDMFAVGLIPAAILLVGIAFMPNSPRWLVFKHQPEKAKKVLERVRGQKDVSAEMREIQTAIQTESKGLGMLRTSAVKYPLIVGLSLAIFQQITGVNTIIYYAPTIFQFAGLDSATAAIAATTGVGLANFLVTALALGLVDKVGRRPLLLVGIAGMVCSLIVLGAGFFYASSSVGSSVGVITAVSLIAYISFFAIGLGPVFWLLISEIFPLQVRGAAMSLATIANWSANFAITLLFLGLVAVLGQSGTFWLFAAIGVVAFIFTLRLVPETKGLTLEQIEGHFRRGGHPRHLGRKHRI